MQFFPAMAPGSGPSSQAFSRFDFMDARASQDFSGLLSQQLNQPDPKDVTPRPTASEPFPGSEPVAPECRAQDATPAAAHGRDASRDREVGMAGHEYREESSVPEGADQVDESAKDAEIAHAAPRNGEDRTAGRAEREAEDASPKAPDGAGPHEAGHPGMEALQEELEAVEGEARERSAANPEVDARIKALRELLGTLHQTDPAERSELAVTLGAQIKALRAELAAPGDKAESAGHASSLAAAEGTGKSGSLQQERSARKGRHGEAPVQAADSDRETAKERASALNEPKAAAGESVARVGAHGSKGAAGLADGSRTDGKAQPDDVIGRTGIKAQAVAAQMPGESGKPALASAGKGPARASADSVREGAKEGRSTLDEPKAAVGVSVARSGTYGSKDAAGHADGAHAGGMAQPEDMLGRAGVKAQALAAFDAQTQGEASDASQAAGSRPATVSYEAALKTSADSASREAVKNHGAAPDDLRADAPDARNVVPAQANGAKGDQTRQDARHGFFGARGEEPSRAAKPAASASGKIVLETEALALGAGQSVQPAALQRGEPPVASRSAEVYRQVESGAFRNLGQGVKQLVIRLDPEELGQISVILQVKGKEVQAVLRASNQEASQALGEQLSQLRTQLEAQGLKVGKLEVQTQLADSQGQPQWQGAEQHNRYQENRELALSAQRWRTLERVDSGLVREVQSGVQREKLSQSGLDIFA